MAPSRPIYVALGSSFAAGPMVGTAIANGLGQGSLSYPFVLVNKLQLNNGQFVNAAKSGALLSEIAATQLNYLCEETKLVTLTAGGNDVDYSKDTLMCAFLNEVKSPRVKQMLLSQHDPTELAQNRAFEQLGHNFDELLRAIRARAPHAQIILVTYITIMPPWGALPPLTPAQTTNLRDCASALRETTLQAAQRNNVQVVDMADLSADHHALAAEPWCWGFDINRERATPVHPNEAGHAATAREIHKIVNKLFFY